MIFNELNEDNFLLFAIKHYENPQAVTKEDFEKDLNHFKYIILNHFIILYNIFGEAATPMLFFKIEKELWSSLKSFIIFLNRLPEYPKSTIHNIQVDLYCLAELNKIYNGSEKT